MIRDSKRLTVVEKTGLQVVLGEDVEAEIW